MYWLILLAMLAINIVLALAMQKAAQLKGYNGSEHAFAYTFFLGIMGCIYVAALPDLVLRKKIQDLLDKEPGCAASVPAVKETAPKQDNTAAGPYTATAGSAANVVQTPQPTAPVQTVMNASKPVAPTVSDKAKSDLADYKTLLDAGIISKEEYEKMVANLK